MCCWVVCGCVVGVSVDDHPGMGVGSRVMIRIPFVIVIPRVLSIFYTCNMDMCLSVESISVYNKIRSCCRYDR